MSHSKASYSAKCEETIPICILARIEFQISFLRVFINSLQSLFLICFIKFKFVSVVYEVENKSLMSTLDDSIIRWHSGT